MLLSVAREVRRDVLVHGALEDERLGIVIGVCLDRVPKFIDRPLGDHAFFNGGGDPVLNESFHDTGSPFAIGPELGEVIQVRNIDRLKPTFGLWVCHGRSYLSANWRAIGGQTVCSTSQPVAMSRS